MKRTPIRLYGGSPVYPGRLLPYVHPWPASPPSLQPLEPDIIRETDRLAGEGKLTPRLRRGDDADNATTGGTS